MNILTFDVEEWYLEKEFFGDSVKKYQDFDRFLAGILDKLDERSIKGTFFCVGGLGREFPSVVQLIHDRGHEIGCHSDVHTWLNSMTPDECLQDTRRAIDSLEQVIGQKVKSYRAPAFSIGKSNKWAIEILAECGIEFDASIFPADRDFGGFSEFNEKTPSIIRYNGIEMKEFPICTKRMLGKEIAYSGGGYFRFFPYSFVKRTISKSDYSMTYFHISDLVPEFDGVMDKCLYEAYFKEKGSFFNRYLRYVKSNIGTEKAYKKLSRLIEEVDFLNLQEASETIDWEQVPFVDI